MSKNKKIIYGIAIVVVILAGVYFLVLNDCQRCRIIYFWSIGSCDITCLNLASDELCQAKLLEDCDGKKVELIGIIESMKSTSLCNLESREVKYGWGCDGPALLNPEYQYKNKKVKIIGTIHKGGEPCQPETQCWGGNKPTVIEVENLEILDQVTITTDKAKYSQGETMQFIIANHSTKEILVSACPQKEGFVEVEKKNEQGQWEKALVNRCFTKCIGPYTLETNGSHSYNWQDFFTCLNDISELNPPGTYRIKFGYLTDLPYTEENTRWTYSNEFEIVGSNAQTTEITLTGARGDFVDPGPIEADCQKYLENYINGIEFINNRFIKCRLVESKVGWVETKDPNECPDGFSPAGCYICKLECQ